MRPKTTVKIKSCDPSFRGFQAWRVFPLGLKKKLD